MKTFTIDLENNITAYASLKAAKADPNLELNPDCFTSEQELADLVGANGKRLVAIWNSLPGVTPVKKFMSSKAAVKRIFAQIQSLQPEQVAVEAEPEAAPAKAPRAKRAKVARAAVAANGKEPREGSKQAQVLAMLRREGGATLEEIMKAMDWQIHTTRALMSAGGAYAKQYGITVISEKVGETRTYRVAS